MKTYFLEVFMKTWQAILFTVALFIIFLFLPPLLTFLAILGTAIWAAVDSANIGLFQYKSGISLKPFTLFLGCILLWIVAFPWYLAIRYRIVNGVAELKN